MLTCPIHRCGSILAGRNSWIGINRLRVSHQRRLETFRPPELIKREMKIMNLKTVVLLTAIAMAFTGLGMVSVGARVEEPNEFNAAATYKSKCVSCHGAKSEKK